LALAAELRASGQTLAAFARARGVSEQRVRYWRHQADREPGEGPPAAVPTPGFFAFQVGGAERGASRAGCDGLEIRVGDALCIVLAPGTAQPAFVQTLRGVLEALER
jgi:transposase-like protein